MISKRTRTVYFCLIGVLMLLALYVFVSRSSLVISRYGDGEDLRVECSSLADGFVRKADDEPSDYSYEFGYTRRSGDASSKAGLVAGLECSERREKRTTQLIFLLVPITFLASQVAPRRRDPRISQLKNRLDQHIKKQEE